MLLRWWFLVLSRCTSGLLYDPKIGVCNWPASVPTRSASIVGPDLLSVSLSCSVWPLQWRSGHYHRAYQGRQRRLTSHPNQLYR